jgi:hypothetical protein
MKYYMQWNDTNLKVCHIIRILLNGLTYDPAEHFFSSLFLLAFFPSHFQGLEKHVRNSYNTRPDYMSNHSIRYIHVYYFLSSKNLLFWNWILSVCLFFAAYHELLEKFARNVWLRFGDAKKSPHRIGNSSYGVVNIPYESNRNILGNH